MTYVEFFDRISVVNICACLTNMPQRVVLIGGEIKPMLSYAEHYKRVFRSRGYEVEFDCQVVKKNDLKDIVRVLTQIVEKYPDCAVDLTGGEDLVLVAMGIVFERFRDKGIQMHRFNVRNNKITDCDQDGITIEQDLLQLTVEENIRINGGDIIYDDDKPNATRRWDMNDDFLADIDRMWEICRQDRYHWNTHTRVLKLAEPFREENENPLITEVQMGTLITHMEQVGAKFVALKGFLKSLYSAGLLYFYDCSDDMLTVIYKNEQVKRCLTKEGMILEMKLYSVMRRLREPDGRPTFDVMQGVYIDWDGRPHLLDEEGCDTANEVDIIAMKGVVPVFISCKNGQFTSDELYKLCSVAERFGGEHAKKILIATSLDKEHPAALHFRQRAEDMKIRIIDDLQDMSEREIEKLLRNIWH